MVLGPFAETKGPRRRGRNPAKIKTVGNAHPTDKKNRGAGSGRINFFAISSLPTRDLDRHTPLRES